jgi:penicillin-binding protein 1A
VRPPVLIRRVEDSDGKVLYQDEKKEHRAVSKATAYLMSSMLADVVNHGTGYRARQAGFTLPAAGKTGTTNDYVDAWFVGYTPRVVTGVWIGFDQPQTIIANGYGGELAVPVWAGFMKAATAGHKKEWFERPDDVVAVNVCRVSGRRATEACGDVEVISSDGSYVESRSMIYTEYFAKGTAPSASCDIHTRRSFFDRITGALGADNEPPPVSADAVGLPPSPTRTTGAQPPRQQVGEPQPAPKVEEEKKKKPGFWGRLFGRGDKDKKDEKKDPPKKKPGGGR